MPQRHFASTLLLIPPNLPSAPMQIPSRFQAGNYPTNGSWAPHGLWGPAPTHVPAPQLQQQHLSNPQTGRAATRPPQQRRPRMPAADAGGPPSRRWTTPRTKQLQNVKQRWWRRAHPLSPRTHQQPLLKHQLPLLARRQATAQATAHRLPPVPSGEGLGKGSSHCNSKNSNNKLVMALAVSPVQLARPEGIASAQISTAAAAAPATVKPH